MHRFVGSEPSACAAAPQASPFQALYDGWLNVERSMIHSMDEYITEGLVTFPGGWVETRQFSWSNPLESVFTTTSRCYMLNLAVSGWLTGATATSLRGNSRRDGERNGRLILVPPDQALQMNSLEGRSRSIRCVLDAEMFEGFLAEAPRWRDDDKLLRAALTINSGQIEWLLRRMYREVRNPDFATPQIIETLAKQLTVEVIRALNLRRENQSVHTGGLAPWRLRIIRQRLWGDDPLPSLDELANLCDMTVRHLSRAFRSETGQTLGKYIEGAMVDRANIMLARGEPVREVARDLGYASSGSFAAAFRRATGLLPSEINSTGKTRRNTRS